ncbi:MAG: 3'-5' exoribonuclease [Halothiobacillus sp.]|nr:3'-5' exoribonuclease [Halothiobacillus sp.]
MMTTYTDISIDLETLGTQPGCPIVSVGMTAFNRNTGDINELGEVHIDVQEQLDRGFEVSWDTIFWWMQQSKDAIFTTFGDGKNGRMKPPYACFVLAHMLHGIHSDDASISLQFSWAKPTTLTAWGNGATFDVSILEAFLIKTSGYRLFDHRKVRDMRTIMDVAGLSSRDIPFTGIAHTAQADATHQAKCIIAAFKRLKGG